MRLLSQTFIAVAKHHNQKRLAEERVYLAYMSIIERSQGRNSSRNLESRTEKESSEAVLLTNLLWMICLAS